jgi:uncharacterized protein YjbJ (UPF0337 family)
MNEPWMKGKWNEFKGKAKEQWGDLTDDELDRVEGRRDQLVGLVQQKYGRSREQAETELSDWERKHGLR